jgi:hypothetical protein
MRNRLPSEDDLHHHMELDNDSHIIQGTESQQNYKTNLRYVFI